MFRASRNRRLQAGCRHPILPSLPPHLPPSSPLGSAGRRSAGSGGLQQRQLPPHRARGCLRAPLPRPRAPTARAAAASRGAGRGEGLPAERSGSQRPALPQPQPGHGAGRREEPAPGEPPGRLPALRPRAPPRRGAAVAAQRPPGLRGARAGGCGHSRTRGGARRASFPPRLPRARRHFGREAAGAEPRAGREQCWSYRGERPWSACCLQKGSEVVEPKLEQGERLVQQGSWQCPVALREA